MICPPQPRPAFTYHQEMFQLICVSTCGYASSSETFRGFFDSIFKGLQHFTMMSYVDDVFAFSRTPALDLPLSDVMNKLNYAYWTPFNWNGAPWDHAFERLGWCANTPIGLHGLLNALDISSLRLTSLIYWRGNELLYVFVDSTILLQADTSILSKAILAKATEFVEWKTIIQTNLYYTLLEFYCRKTPLQSCSTLGFATEIVSLHHSYSEMQYRLHFQTNSYF